MSNTNDYIITTLSSGSNDYNSLCGTQIQAPFSLGVPTVRTLRLTGAPYVVSKNNPAVFTRGIIPTFTETFHVPFAYYNFETSASQYVTNVQGTYAYTGAFEGSGQTYTTSGAFFGTYSMSFPNSPYSRINLGTPNERNGWNTLFSGSFSISMWVKPKHTGGDHRNSQASLFSLSLNNPPGVSPDGKGNRGFTFQIGRNTSFGAPTVQSGQAYGGGWSGTSTFSEGTGSNAKYTNNQWNHYVFIVDGAQGSGNRIIYAYINNVYLGFAATTTASGLTARQFQYGFDPSYSVILGSVYNSTIETFADIDEVSIWDFALDATQVNTLYNGGSGINNMNLLPSGSSICS